MHMSIYAHIHPRLHLQSWCLFSCPMPFHVCTSQDLCFNLYVCNLLLIHELCVYRWFPIWICVFVSVWIHRADMLLHYYWCAQSIKFLMHMFVSMQEYDIREFTEYWNLSSCWCLCVFSECYPCCALIHLCTFVGVCVYMCECIYVCIKERGSKAFQ